LADRTKQRWDNYVNIYDKLEQRIDGAKAIIAMIATRRTQDRRLRKAISNSAQPGRRLESRLAGHAIGAS